MNAHTHTSKVVIKMLLSSFLYCLEQSPYLLSTQLVASSRNMSVCNTQSG